MFVLGPVYFVLPRRWTTSAPTSADVRLVGSEGALHVEMADPGRGVALATADVQTIVLSGAIIVLVWRELAR